MTSFSIWPIGCTHNKAHATILKMGGGGHIREAARFTITLGANKISNFKGK